MSKTFLLIAFVAILSVASATALKKEEIPPFNKVRSFYSKILSDD